MRIVLLHSTILLSLCACSSQPVVPDAQSVETSRQKPAKDCQRIDKFVGRTQTPQGSSQKALSDLKKEATREGANYVQIQQYSGMETAVTGIGYKCP